MPDFYQQISLDSQDYAIVGVPIQFTGTEMYYQTLHNKRVLWGYVARIPPESRKFVDDVPLLRRMRCADQIRSSVHGGIIQKVLETNPEIAPIVEKYIESKEPVWSYSNELCEPEPISKRDIEILQENNIRYIIINKISFDQASLNELEDILGRPDPIYENPEMIVYEIF